MIAEMCVTHKPREQPLVMALGHVYVDICPLEGLDLVLDEHHFVNNHLAGAISTFFYRMEQSIHRVEFSGDGAAGGASCT